MTRNPERYNIQSIERKWQQYWHDEAVFCTPENPDKNKAYILEMFPYPSGHLHMGHVRNYTLGDVLARFLRAQGRDVLYPMGWDAFGLPAENAAKERGILPSNWTYDNIAVMRGQLQRMGFSHDWRREVATCAPEYSAQEQRMFLEFWRHDLIYRKIGIVNWDPLEETVLANEQVIDGKGWRSGVAVEQRELPQWYARISNFSESLLHELEDGLPNWPEKVRLMQINWINRSEGAHIYFSVAHEDAAIRVFTTRHDTLYGASFIALSPGHPLAQAWSRDNAAMADFIKSCEAGGTAQEELDKAEKRGFGTGFFATHPMLGNRRLPIYLANFVLMNYGTGALFGCPAHDQRDLDFARKYDLPVLPVVCPSDSSPDTFTIETEPYVGDGVLINSGPLDGMSVAEAKAFMAQELARTQTGEATTTYRLRDWGISRQRYWGCP
ncbi:MAG: leucine--tRNA ligase, partial [Pseudomonadota bacterium]